LDEQPAQQDRLLGVVGDTAGRHARGDGMTGRGGLEAGQERAPAIADLRPGQHLRRHAQRVANRQPVQRTPRAPRDFHDHEEFSTAQSRKLFTMMTVITAVWLEGKLLPVKSEP
jgi:hypothetical protein